MDHVIRERKEHNLTYPPRYDRAYQLDRWISHSALGLFLPVRFCVCGLSDERKCSPTVIIIVVQHEISFRSIKTLGK